VITFQPACFDDALKEISNEGDVAGELDTDHWLTDRTQGAAQSAHLISQSYRQLRVVAPNNNVVTQLVARSIQ
jgi:hypothetical protein